MDGEIEEVKFLSGFYTSVDKIVRFSDGYGDIYLKNNSGIIKDINLKDALEIHGKTKIEEVSKN
ncbi:uncharacterized protein METZ01_LOCUS334752 [marine metagenome]|uniref:Uncharacterized protein n=1 Tax=marine metagenome TaxID=408172 RepID=A0A382QAB2_9ZZZZ